MITFLLLLILVAMIAVLVADFTRNEEWNWLTRQFLLKYEIIRSPDDQYRVMVYILKRENGEREFAFYIEKQLLSFLPVWVGVDEIRYSYPDSTFFFEEVDDDAEIERKGKAMLAEFLKSRALKKRNSDAIIARYLKKRNG